MATTEDGRRRGGKHHGAQAVGENSGDNQAAILVAARFTRCYLMFRTGTTMLETERKYYDAHKAEWLRTHAGRFVVVKDEQLIGVYDTLDEALQAGAAEFGLVPFLVRRVGEGEQTVTVPALTLGLLGAHS
jgi:hypothetical protein